MGLNIRRKSYIDKDVLEAAYDRIRYLYKMFDKVSVSFSGGKDSTACLHLTIDIARELGRLPVRVIFYDEEAIHPPTVEYVTRVRDMPEVALEWYCLTIRHRNACSNDQPWWQCWDPADKDLWVRPMPPWAITSHPRFKFGMTLPQSGPMLLERNEVCIQGIRTQESFRRYRMMSSKANDQFVSHKGDGRAYGYPIYDWNSVDVWRLVKKRGYDYNRVYDYFNRTRLHGDLLHQRCCPPYGEEPLRGIWMWAECFPELWHKMLYRVKGVATAWRYGNTELYGTGTPPEGMKWQEFCELQLSNYNEMELQRTVRKQVARAIGRHFARTDDSIPEDYPHPLTGLSWAFLCKIAIKGDLKGRQIQMLAQQSTVQLDLMGMTLEEAVRKYGKPQYQKEFFDARETTNRRRSLVARRSAALKQLQPKLRSPARA